MPFVGTKMKKLREDQGMSTTQLAEKVGVSPSYISRLENDLQKPGPSTASKIAAALHVSEAYLMYEEATAPQDFIYDLPENIRAWLTKKDIMPYIALAKDLHGKQISASRAKKAIEIFTALMEEDEEKE